MLQRRGRLLQAFIYKVVKSDLFVAIASDPSVLISKSIVSSPESQGPSKINYFWIKNCLHFSQNSALVIVCLHLMNGLYIVFNTGEPFS